MGDEAVQDPRDEGEGLAAVGARGYADLCVDWWWLEMCVVFLGLVNVGRIFGGGGGAEGGDQRGTDWPADRPTYRPQHRLHPTGAGWGLFGLHTVAADAKEVVLTEGEFDAMAVYQVGGGCVWGCVPCVHVGPDARRHTNPTDEPNKTQQATGRPAVSLPNGCRSLPVEVLPLLERFERCVGEGQWLLGWVRLCFGGVDPWILFKAASLPQNQSHMYAIPSTTTKTDSILLWMDSDQPGVEGAEKFAHKLGVTRTFIVRPLPDVRACVILFVVSSFGGGGGLLLCVHVGANHT